MFDEFSASLIGKQTNPDGAYGYQCVDLVLEYLRRYAGLKPGAYGNAIDYANPAPAVAALVDHVDGASKGDIVVFRGLAGNPYGHIGIASGRFANGQVEVLEQNGATGSGDGVYGNAVRYRYIDTSRVAAVLRPHFLTVAPAPAPAAGQILYLPAVPLWKVYREGGPYTVGNQIGNLTPAAWNGLQYKIVRMVSSSVAIIDTGAYGRVAIYVGAETGATIK